MSEIDIRRMIKDLRELADTDDLGDLERYDDVRELLRNAANQLEADLND